MRYIFIIITLLCHNFAYASDAILVKAEKVSKEVFLNRYEAVGLCKEQISHEYKAKIAGTVDIVNAYPSQEISKGQIILTIDGELAEAKKDKAIAEYESAKTNFERDVNLFKQSILSKESLEKSKVAMETARLAKTIAVQQYEDMVIRAPFDGQIGVIHPQVGDNVSLGDYLFAIIAPGDKNIIVYIPEKLHGKINYNSQVFVIDLSGKQVFGQITEISQYVKENGMIAVKITVPKEANLLHGSYVTAKFLFNEHQALSVNKKSILKNNQGSFVYQVMDGKAKQIYVKTGIRTENNIEITTDEINVGDLVVTEGLTKISVGAPIKLQNTDNSLGE